MPQDVQLMRNLGYGIFRILGAQFLMANRPRDTQSTVTTFFQRKVQKLQTNEGPFDI